MYKGNLGPISNRETWAEVVSYRPADGSPAPELDEVVVTIGGNCTPRTKKLSEGGVVADPGAGTFTFTFDYSDLQHLKAGSYGMGILLIIADVRVQLFTGSIEIFDGIVPCS